MPAVKLNYPRTMSSQGVTLVKGHWKAVSATVYDYFKTMAKERPGQFELDKNKHKDEAPAPKLKQSEAEMWSLFKRMMGSGNFDHEDVGLALEHQAETEAPQMLAAPDAMGRPMSLLDAANTLDPENEDNFSDDGRPSQLALSAKLGRIVTSEEIDKAFPKNPPRTNADTQTGDSEGEGKPKKVVIRKSKQAPADTIDTGAGAQQE